VIQTYYQWTADDNLCSYIEKPGHKYHSKRCKRNIADAVLTQVEPAFFNGKEIVSSRYWPIEGNYSGTRVYTFFYIHIIDDALVTMKGDVISGNLKLVLRTCGKDVKPRLNLKTDNITSIPLYRELLLQPNFGEMGIFIVWSK